jgi:hypothetical protein
VGASVTLPLLLPGDVIVCHTQDALGRVIREFEAIEDKPNLSNHVAVVHHTDAGGNLWVLEARPGGVGWADAEQYDNPYLLTNVEQPKTDTQRRQVCALAVGMLRVGYDWAAIGMDAAQALHLDGLWRVKDFGDAPPAHVVCSSLVWWLMRQAGLAVPAVPGRTVTPADFADWILRRGWVT